MTYDEGLHRAVGWLTSALERAHPGFLAAQADDAREFGVRFPEYADAGHAAMVAVLDEWARRVAQRASVA